MAAKRLHYKLWSDDNILGEWYDRDEAYRQIMAHIEENPDVRRLHLSIFAQTKNGLKPVTGYHGNEIVEFINDVEE
jgi:hypothetical protein